MIKAVWAELCALAGAGRVLGLILVLWFRAAATQRNRIDRSAR